MKAISWQLVSVIIIVVLCVTGLELYALSKGINGTILAGTIALLVGIPSVIITRKVYKKKE